jgi:hypothetical protein
MSTMEDDKILFKAADKNLDNKLSSEEFFTFTNPNIGMMYPVLYAALNAKDQNKDGRISGQELSSNCESSKSNDWRAFERKRFNEDLEIHKDGFLTQSEILAWLMPENIQWDILLLFLKMMVKCGLVFFILKLAPSEIHANLTGQFSLSGQIFVHWAAATLKGLVEFQNKKF